MNRRDFVRLALSGAAVALAPRSARAADARVDVLLDERIGPITADFYGHFVEHLGGVVYDGVWVGENSRIRQHRWHPSGSRRPHAPLSARAAIRWPGGCFADSYDWRDGIGASAQRPTRDELLDRRTRDEGGRTDPGSRTRMRSGRQSSCVCAAW